ncbi:DUF6545 domain-containing protein [Mycobacteroides abscessus]|uniref:DUF6545 domain-containing protein n=1 Tax=Mycobacteroides abscessus TaxID=36809 RepID=UPI000241BF43|nr:DUF6545 domain-containing protein [Mycobacteroides abscessus]EHM23627.1 hypothetical protein MBOL_01730 [Mycobacteroides abscessus subsp. bolletii BD]ORA22581.1 hypothetical protein BST18_24065 [Mycobacteroides abscessus subsp. bolletii]TPF66229.1 hypothetical protein XW60_21790 [Mycobacteroides abscessus subsp. bolletii]SKF80634.1 Uncharacterised protein [Mycobacteroides abscessus subsp. bolletii]SKG78458.1 Uncharacterised protein [Mycobacteroides abscessus subsp. bolletii]
MTSSVPGWLAWPLVVAMAAVIAVRYRWFNTTLYDTYFNNTLLLMLIAQLLRERVAEDLLDRNRLLSITAAQHLSLLLVFFMAGEFMGFITRWSGLSPEQTRARHRYHRLAATVLAAAFFAVTTRARIHGQLLEVSGGWDNVIAWGLYAVLPVALAMQIISMCMREIRRPDAKQRERIVAGSAIPIAVAIGITTTVAMFLELFEELGWAHTLDYRLTTHAYIFFWEAIGTAAVAAIPIVLAVVAYLGWDSTSRMWCRLQRIRSDMLTAVPDAGFEIAFNSCGRRKTALELHQTTVQIRDAILRLRPYYPGLGGTESAAFLREYSVPPKQNAEAVAALQLAAAVRAKDGGVGPSTEATEIVRSRSTTLDEETRELLALSRWWPRARAYVDQLSETPPTPTVNDQRR